MSIASQVSALATRVGVEFKSVRTEMAGLGAAPAGVFDVTAYGATGDGSTDDTTAIQAAITASTAGGTVWFPGGTYKVTSCIQLPADRAYLGAGGRSQLTTIQAAAGVVGAVMAPPGWYNSAESVGCINVEGIMIDGGGLTGVHGLVVYNFWSRFYDVMVMNTGGNGFHVTDMGRNGAFKSISTMSENTFTLIRTSSIAGNGFYNESTNDTARAAIGQGAANQDGHILDSFFSSSGQNGIYLSRASGWTVDNCHLYGVGINGIRGDLCYGTKFLNNYVEGFGENNASGQYYNGIVMATLLSTRGSAMANNTVSSNQPSSPTGARWTCYYARPNAGQTLANLTFSGNVACFSSDTAPATSRTWAVQFGEGSDTGRMMYVGYGANTIEGVSWWQTVRSVAAASVTMSEPRMLVPVASGSVSSSITSDASVGGDVRDITVTGSAVSVGVPTNPTNRQTLEYCFYASVATTVTFNSSIRLSTGLSSRAFVVGSGQVLYASLQYSSLISAWTLLAAAVSAT